MKRAEIVTALLLGIFSIYLMWKSGEPPSWDPTVPRFANIGMIEGEGPGSGFWPFWLSLFMLISCLWIGINWFRILWCHSIVHDLLHEVSWTPWLVVYTFGKFQPDHYLFLLF
jgi:hypothetical protein